MELTTDIHAVVLPPRNIYLCLQTVSAKYYRFSTHRLFMSPRLLSHRMVWSHFRIYSTTIKASILKCFARFNMVPYILGKIYFISFNIEYYKMLVQLINKWNMSSIVSIHNLLIHEDIQPLELDYCYMDSNTEGSNLYIRLYLFPFRSPSATYP